MEPTSYAQAEEELRNILRQLDSNSLDVDELVKKYERAKQLLQYCTDKIENAKMTVEKLENTN